jgi:hypothetical protein
MSGKPDEIVDEVTHYEGELVLPGDVLVFVGVIAPMDTAPSGKAIKFRFDEDVLESLKTMPQDARNELSECVNYFARMFAEKMGCRTQ